MTPHAVLAAYDDFASLDRAEETEDVRAVCPDETVDSAWDTWQSVGPGSSGPSRSGTVIYPPARLPAGLVPLLLRPEDHAYVRRSI